MYIELRNAIMLAPSPGTLAAALPLRLLLPCRRPSEPPEAHAAREEGGGGLLSPSSDGFGRARPPNLHEEARRRGRRWSRQGHESATVPGGSGGYAAYARATRWGHRPALLVASDVKAGRRRGTTGAAA
jgi:hypothetical protein